LTRKTPDSHNKDMRAGQALILVLLLLSVIITVGLAISSRSVTEVGISATQEESARALSAAEAGIEAALSGTVAIGSPVSVGSTGTYIVPASSQYGNDPEVVFSEGVRAGEAVTLFLTPYKADGTFDTALSYTGTKATVCWQATGATPALEAIMYYQNGSGKFASRNVYDPGNGIPGAVNVDNGVSGCPTGQTYSYKKDINFQAALNAGGLGVASSNTLLFLRLKPYYNGDNLTTIGVASGGADFPAQGQLMTSTGQSGQTSRRVQVIKKYPDPLPYLDNAVFSGGSLSKKFE